MKNMEASEMFKKHMECDKRWYSHNNDECWDTDCETECPYYVSRADEEEMNATILSALEKQEQDRWIPVTERLPEENGRYIICYEDATTFLDYFNGKWFFPIGKNGTAWEETGTIIAWRPLPEAYTEGTS